MDNQKDDYNDERKKLKDKVIAALFLSSVTGAGILFGFSSALAMAKKKDSNMFNKGMSLVSKELPESGISLATRALGWGSLYAVSGFSLFCFIIWKSLGVKDLKEFRYKVGSWLPRITNEQQQGRTEFKSIRDLLQYIIDEDEKTKKK